MFVLVQTRSQAEFRLNLAGRFQFVIATSVGHWLRPLEECLRNDRESRTKAQLKGRRLVRPRARQAVDGGVKLGE